MYLSTLVLHATHSHRCLIAKRFFPCCDAQDLRNFSPITEWPVASSCQPDPVDAIEGVEIPLCWYIQYPSALNAGVAVLRILFQPPRSPCFFERKYHRLLTTCLVPASLRHSGSQ